MGERLTQRLDIKQGQTLTMTPQMQQSLKLLQLSTQELASYIEQEIEQNPLLERADPNEETEPTALTSEISKQEEDTPDYSEDYEPSHSAEENTLPSQEEGVLDVDYENVWDAGENDVSSTESTVLHIDTHQSDTSGSGGEGYYEQLLSKETTLREHLLDQITLDIEDPVLSIVAVHLLDMLDENGYISDDFSTLIALLECDESLIEETLSLLQKLDPPGVFARSLAECLTLQLIDKDRFDPAMEQLVNHLDVLGKCDFARLEKLCGVNSEDLKDMCEELRALNPKPGNDFLPEVVQTAQADIFLNRANDGTWALELNSDALPRLLVNHQYYAEVKGKSKDDAEKKYIIEKLSTANWLVKTLHQRAETILKVASELVSQQQAFFDKGIHYLKPLTLRHVADELEIHESTVGRVTTNKYIATPRGLYEMKFFFSSSINNADSDQDYSSKTVKHLIKELIDKETPDNILSDDKLAGILQSQGVDVARRTVAKYREAMRIPSSTQRRQQKRLQA